MRDVDKEFFLISKELGCRIDERLSDDLIDKVRYAQENDIILKINWW